MLNALFTKSPNKIQYIHGIKRKIINFLLVASMVKRTYKYLRDASPSLIGTINLIGSQIKLASLFKNNKPVYFNGNVFFDCYAPKWPGKVFDRLGDILLRNLGKEPEQWTPFIPYLVLSITRKCVYRCEHCYTIHSLGGKDVLSLEKLLQIAKDSQKIGVGIIAWEGGEPLLRFDDLITLLRETHSESEAWLATTAYGLTYEKAQRLKEAGLTAAIISLDHYEPDKHNKFRGNEKAFDMAVNGVRIFRESGIFPCLCICATRDIVEEGGLYHYLELAKEIGAAFIQIVDAMPSGNYLGKDVILSKSQIEEIKRFQIKVNTESRYRDYPSISARAYFEDDSMFGCSACNGTCYVDSSGNVQSCVYMHIKFGNVFEESIEDIYKRMKRYFPHFSSGRCPVQTFHKAIAKEYEKHKVLPLPYENCIHILDKIGKRGLPINLQSIQDKQRRKGFQDFIYPRKRRKIR